MEKRLERARKSFMEDFRRLKKSWSSIKPYRENKTNAAIRRHKRLNSYYKLTMKW